MTPPEYVLFDCDGVLVDSEPLTTRLLRDDLANHGVDLRLSEIHDLFVGGTMAGVFAKARTLGADLPDDWLTHIFDKMFTLLAAECEPVPGIAAVLDRLDAAGIGYAVGSNGPMAKMDVTLKRCGLRDRFEGRIFSAHDCPASKPAPDVYLKAAGQAGIDPVRCAVIEDSVSGARAGRAAGARTFGFTADTARDVLAPYCHATFADMSELPGLLGL